MKESKPETGLATTRVVEGQILDAASFNTQIAAWTKAGFIVLTPTMRLSSIPRDHKMLYNEVRINPNPAGGEVYQNPLFTKNGEVALTKAGLEKIAQCAGISIDESCRTDSRTVENIWSYRVKGHWLGFDGSVISRIANKTLDLRDGSIEIKGFTKNQIDQARRHGEAVCESKAINRLYRQYGLRQKYAQQELAECSFMVFQLQWDPDLSNPIVASIYAQYKTGALGMLYAPGSSVDLATVPQLQLPPDFRSVKSQELPDDDQPGSSNEIPFEDDDEDGGLLLGVKSVTQSAGTDDFFVTFDNDMKLHTAHRGVAKACNVARKDGLKLRVYREGDDIAEVKPASKPAGTVEKY